MPEATMTSKGQMTIPKSIREKAGLQPGVRVAFTALPNGTILMRLKNKSILDLAGMLHREGREPLPVELLSR